MFILVVMFISVVTHSHPNVSLADNCYITSPVVCQSWKKRWPHKSDVSPTIYPFLAKNNPTNCGLLEKLVSRFHRSIFGPFQVSCLKHSLWESCERLAKVIDKIRVNFEGFSKRPQFWRASNESAGFYEIFFFKSFFFLSKPYRISSISGLIFPQNHYLWELCHQSFIGGKKLLKMATTYRK